AGRRQLEASLARKVTIVSELARARDTFDIPYDWPYLTVMIATLFKRDDGQGRSTTGAASRLPDLRQTRVAGPRNVLLETLCRYRSRPLAQGRLSDTDQRGAGRQGGGRKGPLVEAPRGLD